MFKPAVPFIKRAEELDRDVGRAESKVVAFYLRQFAIEVGIAIKDKEPIKFDESKQFLFQLMDELERTKSMLPPMTKDEGKVQGKRCNDVHD